MILGFLAWETDLKGFKGLLEILNAHNDVWRDGIQEKKRKNQVEVMTLINSICEDTEARCF